MTKDNIVYLPKSRGRFGCSPLDGRPVASNESPAADNATAQARSAGKRLATWSLYGVRYALFLVMMWVRGPLRFLLGLVGLSAIIALPLIYLGYEGANKGELLLLSGGAGFGSFLLGWFYDSALLALSPDPISLN